MKNSRVNWYASVVVLILIVAGLLLGGCGTASPSSEASVSDEYASYFSTNQIWVEGLSADDVDLEDVDAVFWHVFSRLPEQVTVYPSENYYYFILMQQGRQIWGNIRLAAGYRERGELSFAYFEFDEFPTVPKVRGFTRAKMYTAEDGVTITSEDDFTWVVGYNDREVTFNLHKIPQEPPKLFSLGEDEVFVERTLDESGYFFFLIFNEKKNYFIWILNEENGTSDMLDPVGDNGDILVGRRSGFAFWVDAAHDNRKTLFAIRELSVRRNDYYDGPFDQLADNYAAEVKISDYMVKAFPALEGRIDQFGYYTDSERPLRVAISTYTTYYTEAQITQFVERAKVAEDPYQYISRRGVPEVTTPPDSQPADS